MTKKRLIIFSLFGLLFFSAGLLSGYFFKSLISSYLSGFSSSTNIVEKTIEKPLSVYTIENLSNSKINPGQLSIIKSLAENDTFSSYLFEFKFQPNPNKNDTKTTTGLINIPKEKNPPVLLLIRGYVDQKLYNTGDGTKRVAEFFADKGYLTIAPDFLGYGGSESESDNIFESRFQTYTTVLSLLTTIESTPYINLPNEQSTKIYTDNTPIFIWGHSNGGQIALTILEISGKNFPTSLWAPVSKPFPYSVLYYTDESDDKGRLIRSELAKFEQLYDVEKYSLSNYFDRIKAPIILHQGTIDDAVPISWSNSLNQILKTNNIDIEYIIHNFSDHNLMPAWNEAVEQDFQFFSKLNSEESFY